MDILQRLGLTGKKAQSQSSSSSVTSHSVPQGVIPFKSGVILTQRARIKTPVAALIPASYGTNLAIVLSLCSHRINNAFLFSVRNKKKKLQLGVQFIPGKIIVYVGHKQSVYFDYDVHDGQWHHMAINIRSRKVTLYTSCGKNRTNANLHFKKEDSLDPDGSFLLGKMNQNSVQFEGAICQFDIYPSAKAAHNYCKYIKKQCRQADIYRPNLLPLLPVLPQFPNSSVITSSPLLLHKKTGKDDNCTEKSALMGTAQTMPNIKIQTNKRASFETTTQPALLSTQRRNTASPHRQMATTTLLPSTELLQLPPRIKSPTTAPAMMLSHTAHDKSTKKKNERLTKQQGPKSSDITTEPVMKKKAKVTVNVTTNPTSTKPVKKKPEYQSTENHFETQKPSTVLVERQDEQPQRHNKQPSEKNTEQKSTTQYDSRGTYTVMTVTPAATDGYQTFGMESYTVDPLFQEQLSIKGDPGPKVRFIL